MGKLASPKRKKFVSEARTKSDNEGHVGKIRKKALSRAQLKVEEVEVSNTNLAARCIGELKMCA